MAFIVDETNIVYKIRLSTATKGSNAVAVTFKALDTCYCEVGDSGTNGRTVITNSKLRISKDNVFGMRSTPGVSVSSKVAIG